MKILHYKDLKDRALHIADWIRDAEGNTNLKIEMIRLANLVADMCELADRERRSTGARISDLE